MSNRLVPAFVTCLLALAAAIHGCGSESGVCNNLQAGVTALNAAQAPCEADGGAAPATVPLTCSAAIGSCTATEIAALDGLATCWEALPTCSASTFSKALADCTPTTPLTGECLEAVP